MNHMLSYHCEMILLPQAVIAMSRNFILKVKRYAEVVVHRTSSDLSGILPKSSYFISEFSMSFCKKKTSACVCMGHIQIAQWVDRYVAMTHCQPCHKQVTIYYTMTM